MQNCIRRPAASEGWATVGNTPSSPTRECDMKTCPFCAEEIQDAAIKCKHCGSDLSEATPTSLGSDGAPRTMRLSRSTGNKVLSGVCGGLASYFGLDPTLVRIVYALVCFFTAIVPGIIVYIILTIIIPKDDRAGF